MKILSLLPPNASPPELALEDTHAERIESLPVPIRQIRRPLATPLEFIPWLAWDNGVTWWEDEWSDQQKRQAIKAAWSINKHRGTAGAVRRALAAVDYLTELIEWFQESPKSQPYTFKVVIYGSSISEDTLSKLTNQINDAKNVRSYLAGIVIKPQAVSGNIFIGGSLYISQSVTITAKKRDE